MAGSFTGYVITLSGLLYETLTVCSVRPLGRGVSTGSGSLLHSPSTNHTAFSPETPGSKPAVNTWKKEEVIKWNRKMERKRVRIE